MRAPLFDTVQAAAKVALNRVLSSEVADDPVATADTLREAGSLLMSSVSHAEAVELFGEVRWAVSAGAFRFLHDLGRWASFSCVTNVYPPIVVLGVDDGSQRVPLPITIALQPRNVDEFGGASLAGLVRRPSA